MASGSAHQRWIADRYARNARFVAELGEALLDMLSPRAGERILDLGCGDGALHWMRRPDLVIDGMWRALRPGGV